MANAINTDESKTMTFATATYKGYDIINNGDTWEVIDDYGSGHVCESWADCKETIDNWHK